MAIEADVIDARGLKCPLPVLKLEKRLSTLRPGERLVVLTTDPMAKIDLPLHCRQHGHVCVEQQMTDHLQFTVTKAAEFQS